jgi:glycosyltransferase involved in cell wall biosynthesis
VVAVVQSGVQANGSLESLTEILRSVGTRDLVVLTNRESTFTGRWRTAGAEVVVRPDLWRATRSGGRRFSRAGQAWRAAWTNLLAYRFFMRLDARLIHFNDARAFASVGLGAKLAGMASTIDVRLLVGRFAAFERIALIACDNVVGLSDDMAGRLTAVRGVPGLAAKVVVIPSGVDRERVEAAGSIPARDWRRKLGVAESTVAIGFVGRVSQRKQQVEFVRRAVPAIGAANDWTVYFLGDFHGPNDPYARSFRAAMAASPAGRRMFHPGFTAEILGWYRALDLVVVASTHEGCRGR